MKLKDFFFKFDTLNKLSGGLYGEMDIVFKDKNGTIHEIDNLVVTTENKLSDECALELIEKKN